MRTTTTGELADLALAARREDFRLWIANSGGTLVDFTSKAKSISLRASVDTPAVVATIVIARETSAGSDAPLMNSPATTDVGRRVKIDVDVTSHTGTPSWKVLFDGTIHEPGWGGDDGNVTFGARDKWGDLEDTFIESESTYGSSGGTAIATVIQSILTDNGTGVTLLTVGSPSTVIYTYTQRRQSVGAAIRALADVNGWDLRFKWHDGSADFRLTFEQPNRTKTVPDHTFTTADYRTLPRVRRSSTGIRNVCEVQYTSSGASVTSTDTTSTGEHGRRYMFVDSSQDPQITTSGVAIALADAIVGDLAQPLLDQQVDMRFRWNVELGDLYRFPSNSVHYNSAQDGAVIGYTHELRAGAPGKTVLDLRGTPSGGTRRWTRKAGVTSTVKEITTGPHSIPPSSDTILPSVDVQTEQVGASGVLTLTITDPDNLIDATAFEPFTGGGDFDFTTSPTGWAIYDPTAATLTDSVALSEGHNSFVAYAYRFDPGTGSVWIRDLVTFDLNRVPSIAGGLHLTGSGVWLSWNGDEDTGSIRYAVATTGVPSTGAVAAGTVAAGRESDGVLVTNIAENTTAYVRARGYTTSGGGGTESAADFTGFVQRPTDSLFPRPPEVRVSTSQNATSGSLSLTISDPDSVVNGSSFISAAGGATFDFSGNPTGWAGYDGAAPYDTTYSVAIVGGHNSRIAWGVRYDLGEGAGDEWTTNDVVFDLDVVPRFSCGLHLTGSTVWLSHAGDEDTGSIRYLTSTTGIPATGGIGAGTVVPGQESDGTPVATGVASGSTVYVRARAYTTSGGGGTSSPTDFTGQVQRPTDTDTQFPRAPKVAVQTSTTGNTGAISLTISDPDSTLNGTSFIKSTGGNPFDFTGGPSGWPGFDGTPAYDTTETVQITGDHNSRIGWGVRYDLGEGVGNEWETGEVVFDADTTPDITASLNRVNTSIYLSVVGDDDVGSIRYATSTTSTPSGGAVAAGTIVAGQSSETLLTSSLGATSTLFVRVRPYETSGGGGDAGPDWTGRTGETVPDGGVTAAKIASGAVIASKMTQSAQSVASNLTFFSTSYSNISWGVGTLEFTDGTTVNILAGSQTMTLAAPTTYFVYYDGTTTLKVTTSYGTAVGTDGNLILCTAQRGSNSAEGEAFFVPLVGMMRGGIRIGTKEIAANAITANEIRANTITANELAADSVTAVEIDVVNLSSIQVNAGTITAGELQNVAGTNYIDLDATGAGLFIKAGTDFSVAANGTAIFGGTVTATEFTASQLNVTGGDLNVYGNNGGVIACKEIWQTGGASSLSVVGGKIIFGSPFEIHRPGINATGAISITSGNVTTVRNQLTVSGDLTVQTNTDLQGDVVAGGATTDTVGFYGSTGATKQTITGSRNSNAALADLLNSLASLGLITNSTSA